eukprot:COSAG05_NODE_994_length_6264_cov_3.618329_2_plen_582_part_00
MDANKPPTLVPPGWGCKFSRSRSRWYFFDKIDPRKTHWDLPAEAFAPRKQPPTQEHEGSSARLAAEEVRRRAAAAKADAMAYRGASIAAARGAAVADAAAASVLQGQSVELTSPQPTLVQQLQAQAVQLQQQLLSLSGPQLEALKAEAARLEMSGFGGAGMHAAPAPATAAPSTLPASWLAHGVSSSKIPPSEFPSQQQRSAEIVQQDNHGRDKWATGRHDLPRRQSGTCVKFDKGFGFIRYDESGTPDVFFHHSVLPKGADPPQPSDRLTFSLAPNPKGGGVVAKEVRFAGANRSDCPGPQVEARLGRGEMRGLQEDRGHQDSHCGRGRRAEVDGGGLGSSSLLAAIGRTHTSTGAPSQTPAGHRPDGEAVVATVSGSKNGGGSLLNALVSSTPTSAGAVVAPVPFGNAASTSVTTGGLGRGAAATKPAWMTRLPEVIHPATRPDSSLSRGTKREFEGETEEADSADKKPPPLRVSKQARGLADSFFGKLSSPAMGSSDLAETPRHPPVGAESASPLDRALLDEAPRNPGSSSARPCKFGINCHRPDCWFGHPAGWNRKLAQGAAKAADWQQHPPSSRQR